MRRASVIELRAYIHVTLASVDNVAGVTKFGIDKRKAHLANLIFSGQISKEAALEELKEPIYPQEIFVQDYEFVLKKLNLTESEWQAMMRNPPRSHYDFEYERPLYDRKPWLKPLRPLARFVEKLLSRKA